MLSVIATSRPDGRIPRHVWALLLAAVLVLGFALGGSVRTALSAGPGSHWQGAGPPIAAAAGYRPPGAPGTAVEPAHLRLVRAVTVITGRAGGSPATSASRRGVALPAGSGSGRRIVYEESTMHLWVVAADGSVLRDYPVTGRPDWPLAGTYHVFSKAVTAVSPRYRVMFDWMVSFAHGHTLPIGFHSIPRWLGSGKPIQSESSLGAPIGHGGCVRQRPVDAKWLFSWASIGTTVVVVR